MDSRKEQHALQVQPEMTGTIAIAGPSTVGTPLQAQGVTISGGDLVQAGRDAIVTHHHYHLPPAPKIDVAFLLRLVRNLRQIQQDNFSKATPGTGIWIIITKEFVLWLDPNGNLKILWGTGIPGAGKTVLASIVINDLEKRAAADARICVAYIYFRYTDGADLTIRDVLEILVKQTIERHDDCASIAEEAYSRHIREGTGPTEAELLQLLSRFIEVKLVTFYVLDALDEAPVKIQADLVKRLASLNVRLFITSRPLKAVEARLPDAHGFTIIAQEEDLDLHISQEITRSRDLHDLLERVEPSIKGEIISSIKKNCGGMFLLASLQLNQLYDCANTHEAMEILEAFPSNIEDVYLRTWDRILKQRHAPTAKAVLLWVLYAMRPMTIDEVECAVATCPITYNFEADRIMSRETLMTICCGLVTIEDDSRLVRLVHYTARDVLQKRLGESFAHPHSLLAAICMTHLTQYGFQNKMVDSIYALAALLALLKGDPLLAYAYDAWNTHARESLDDAESRRRTASFVAPYKAFPSDRSPRSTRLFNTLRPFHALAYHSLPLDLTPRGGIGDPNIATGTKTALPSMLGSWIGNEKMVEDLLDLEDIDVNFSDAAVSSVLLCAANNGHERAMNLILAHIDVDANLIFDNGRSALMIAASRGHEGIAQLLLARPEIQVNSVGRGRSSALMEAARGGHEGIVKLLLARLEIQVNTVDNDGSSALMEAVRNVHEGIVKLLLAHPEIQVNAVDGGGSSALMKAACSGHQCITKLLLAWPEIQVNLADKNGSSALIKAACSGHKGIVKFLLARPEIQVNLVDNNGSSALMKAVRNGRKGAVKLLLERPGLQVDLTDRWGQSALVQATQKGHTDIMSALVAYPGFRGNHENLPLDLDATLSQANTVNSPTSILIPTEQNSASTSTLSVASVADPPSSIPVKRRSEDTWEVSAPKRRKIETVSEED